MFEFVQLGREMVLVRDMRVSYIFNINIKYMRVGARRHRARQGKLGGEDKGGR